jgi:hypothetical protein
MRSQWTFLGPADKILRSLINWNWISIEIYENRGESLTFEMKGRIDLFVFWMIESIECPPRLRSDWVGVENIHEKVCCISRQHILKYDSPFSKIQTKVKFWEMGAYTSSSSKYWKIWSWFLSDKVAVPPVNFQNLRIFMRGISAFCGPVDKSFRRPINWNWIFLVWKLSNRKVWRFGLITRSKLHGVSSHSDRLDLFLSSMMVSIYLLPVLEINFIDLEDISETPGCISWQDIVRVQRGQNHWFEASEYSIIFSIWMTC